MPEREGIPDVAVCQEVLNGIGVQTQPRKIERLGRRFENQDPDGGGRPLRACLENENVKSDVLKNAVKIRKCTEASFNCRTVFISPDLTQFEREEEKKLRGTKTEASYGPKQKLDDKRETHHEKTGHFKGDRMAIRNQIPQYQGQSGQM